MNPTPLLLAVTLTVTLAACGRPLSEGETRFARTFIGESIDTTQVRITRSPFVQLYRSTAPVPPRLTCTQRLFPPTDETTWTGSPSATVLYNTIHTNPDVYLLDYMELYPQAANLLAKMHLAHELVHVWQWQNRDVTGYHPLKAAAEHRVSQDPYLFDLNTKTAFTDFGYEQQGAIAGEFMCCAALAPNAPRTARLEALLAPHFPVRQMRANLEGMLIQLPWAGAERDTICDAP